MKFTPSLLDEIRARLPVSEVVRGRVRLKKQGREWVGLSPFNAEKTPSFFVNDQKGFYHDFSSGAHGDIFKFVMETEGLSFPEAVSRLAEIAGVHIPESSHRDPAEEKRRKDIYEVLESACAYFESRLRGSVGAKAREYLAGRGISPETQAEFRIGYAPDERDALKKFLLQKGISEQQLVAAGLLITPEDGRTSFDRFRGRIIFPIQDAKGRIIAFGGRAMLPDAKPKYLNSPETELFHKGEIVFNAHRARPHAHETGGIVVVEGYVDAISLFQSGIKAVVATLGTAFTPEQIGLLWRFGSNPVVCFDGDSAGYAAAYRAVERILPSLRMGNSFNFVFLPQGQDPDDFVRKEGAEAFRSLVGRALPLWDLLWRREINSGSLVTPEQRAALEARFQALVGLIPDRLVQKHYWLKIKVSLMDLFWRHDRQKKGNKQKVLNPSPMYNQAFTKYIAAERVFLGLCVEYPELVHENLEEVAALNLSGRHKGHSYSEFLQNLISIFVEQEEVTCLLIYSRLSDQFYEILQSVHGRDERGQPSGHKLREKFPVLNINPPLDFIRECFQHFMDIFVLHDMEEELTLAVEHDFPVDPTEEFEMRILSKQREILRRRDSVRSNENRLAEEAADFKAISGAPPRFDLRAIG